MIITKNSTTPEALRESMASTQSMFRVAAIQMASGPLVAANLQEAGRLIELAAATGARIVALPEYFAIMGMKDTDKVNARERDGDGPIQAFLSEQSKRHRIWIVGGSPKSSAADVDAMSPASGTCSCARWRVVEPFRPVRAQNFHHGAVGCPSLMLKPLPRPP